jgi:hypothetical protein
MGVRNLNWEYPRIGWGDLKSEQTVGKSVERRSRTLIWDRSGKGMTFQELMI